MSALAEAVGQFSAETERVAEGVAQAIDVKAFAFAQLMKDNSNELARIINAASASATVVLSRTLKELQNSSTGSV